MWVIWIALASGFFMPADRKIELACWAYFFVLGYQILRVPKYAKMLKVVRFRAGEEHDIYHRCYNQTKFHTHMVLVPLLTTLIMTFLFTFTWTETLNYYNVHEADVNRTSGLTPRGSYMYETETGCTDSRATNYNSLAEKHIEDTCQYARCYEDIYDFENLSPKMKAFTALLMLIYLMYFGSAYLVSHCHLAFVEKLYLERNSAQFIMKDVWRKVIRSNIPSQGIMSFFAASRIRYFNILQFFFSGLLCCALMIGKWALWKHWFLEFDISIIIWGYEAGRHFPHVGYIAKGLDQSDLYLTAARLGWHQRSMYHYFALTAAQAYLCVSGAYRMMPPERNYVLICLESSGSKLDNDTRNSAVIAAGVSFFFLVFSASWLTIAHYFQYQDVKRDHSTWLAFAASFKNLLQRRRQRQGRAIDAMHKATAGSDGFMAHLLEKNGTKLKVKLYIVGGALKYYRIIGKGSVEVHATLSLDAFRPYR